jgi:N-acetylmuramoyl-L-alanine amidase
MKFKVKSAGLKFIAIASAALMVVLVLSGIQAIARNGNTPGLPTPSDAFTNLDRRSEANLPTQIIPLPGQTQPSAASPKGGAPATPDSGTSLQARRRSSPSPAPSPANRTPSPTPRPSPVARPTPSPAARPAVPQTYPVIPAPLQQSTVNMPTIEAQPADATNFGDRYATDITGKPVSNALLVVLHETVGSASGAINLMKTAHPRDEDQVSYHSIIRRNGTIIFLVPFEKRAYGAGNSVYVAPNGQEEAVKTHRQFPPSVNNFAYHISLETPSDGNNSARSHSGYTDDQYASTAWLTAWTRVPNERIVTHREVDRSGSRIDPRSFDRDRFLQLLSQYPRG